MVGHGKRPSGPRWSRRGVRALLRTSVLAACLAAAACGQTSPSPAASRAPDVRYEPSPMPVVEVMLQLADVTAGDVVYDLGCGDGRIVIAAALRGARGICVDIDATRIAESRENARAAGVAERIRFLTQDLFDTDMSEATVVMLFLSAELNQKLRPKLLRELRPGARIVSHWHDMGDWKPEQTVQVLSGGRRRPVYLWIVPARPAGGGAPPVGR